MRSKTCLREFWPAAFVRGFASAQNKFKRMPCLHATLVVDHIHCIHNDNGVEMYRSRHWHNTGSKSGMLVAAKRP